MRALLEKKKVHRGILERLEHYQCPACAEMKVQEPRPPAATRRPDGPWMVIGSDMAEWTHPDLQRDERLFILV